MLHPPDRSSEARFMYHAAAGVWMYVCVCGPDAFGACYQLVVSRTGRYRTAWDDLQVQWSVDVLFTSRCRSIDSIVR